MKTFLVLALSTFSIFVETTKKSPYPSKDIAKSALDSMDGHIINGYLNKPGEIPYIVHLVSWSDYYTTDCGGSIIDHEWILTAAHCFQYMTHVNISYGNITWEKSPIQHSVEDKNFFIHKGYRNYNNVYAINDIALIKTPYVEFSDSITNISLPKSTNQSYVNKWARASGWGILYAENDTNRLRSMDVKITKNDACQKYYSHLKLDPTHLCTGINSTRSICTGDSGGPLVLYPSEIPDGQPVLIGISSFVKAGCIPKYPNVFTRVSKFLDWIQKTMKRN